jgi:uncharacterized protein involved in response to NO
VAPTAQILTAGWAEHGVRQSRHGLMLFPLLAAASLAHRLMAEDPALAGAAARAGVAMAVLLISAIGGRLVPSLTRNVLAGRGADRVPEPHGPFYVAVLVSTPPGLVAWTSDPAIPRPRR